MAAVWGTDRQLERLDDAVMVRFWLNLQSRYDLEIERDRLGNRLRKEVSVLARAS